MSFERPTLKEIIARLDGDTQSRLSVPQMRRSNARVFDRVLAGAAHSLYGYIEYLNRQQFLIRQKVTIWIAGPPFTV